jgi:rubrerythrin
MSKPIDFSSLSLQDTLDLAIAAEEEARERYEEFASQLELHHSPDVAAFFRHMAGNEIKHAERLRERRSSLFGDTPATADTSLIVDVEAPEYDKARAFMSVTAALKVALASEVKAHDFYDHALPRIVDAEVAALFRDLRQEELRHQRTIEKYMAKAPVDPSFDPDDFVDPPVGQ